MQQKTSSKHFLKYGSVYDQPLDLENHNMTCTDFSINAKRSISQLYCFDCPVYIEMQSGMASILIGEEPDAELMEVFAVHRQISIKAGL